MKKLLAVSIGLIVIFFSIQYSRAYLRTEELIDVQGRALKEGDLISASDYGDPDIYIINFGRVAGLVGYGELPDIGSSGYKRLFLNPAIFSFYGHLGGFANVHRVTPRVRDAFGTSGLFRNCETNDARVWATEVTGEDNGILHHVQITGDQAVAEDPYFFGKVFCINTREDNFYAKSTTPYYRLADVPLYFRRTCQIRPACLDSEPRCLMPEPVEGWCSGPTPTPPPGCYYQEVQCVRAPCYPELVCPTPISGSCYVGGCSGQLCTDQPGMVSTCEWRNEYYCYQRHGRCERQSDGLCGWAATSEFNSCRISPPTY